MAKTGNNKIRRPTPFTIAKKLKLGVLFMVLMLLLIVITGIISINNLSRTSNNIETEYFEVNATQQLRISFQETILSINNYLINGNNEDIQKIYYSIDKTKDYIKNCKQIIINSHSQELLNVFEHDIVIIESLSKELFKLDTKEDAYEILIITEKIDLVSNLVTKKITSILNETQKEMNKYIKANHETNKNGKISIVLIGVVTLFYLLFGGFFFLRGIIRPLNRLNRLTHQVSSGNYSTKTNIINNDEIGNVIESFNDMVQIIDKTTVSRYYFDTILNKMIDSLIITDANETIKVVNNSLLNLLGYSKKEIIGQPFGILLKGIKDKESFNKKTINEFIINKQTNNIYNTYYTKDGNKVPVLFSCSLLQDSNGKHNGILCIAKSIDNNIIVEPNSQNKKIKKEIPLTYREKEVLRLIAEEYSNIEIAEKLFISIRTVETHRKNLMHKLNTKNVISLIKYAVLNGII